MFNACHLTMTNDKTKTNCKFVLDIGILLWKECMMGSIRAPFSFNIDSKTILIQLNALISFLQLDTQVL